MTTEIEARIKQYHETYCLLSGQKVRMGVKDYPRERFWYEFLKNGFTLGDLSLVITHLKGEIYRGKRNEGALRFSNLIQEPHRFEEELALAKAQIRNAKPHASARSVAVAQLRPIAGAIAPEANPDTAKHISVWIQQMRDAVNNPTPENK
jgi:hypothetical protein